MLLGADEATFRRGTRLGIDWGTTRVGVAACDPDALLTYPVETIPARNQQQALVRLKELVGEYEPIEIVMGLPLALDGRAAQAAEFIQEVAELILGNSDVPLRLVDERLTTAAADKLLAHVDTRARRHVIDQLAAVGILEGTLAYERHTGSPPGQLCVCSSTEGEE